MFEERETTTMDCLIGKTIIKIEINDDKTFLKFTDNENNNYIFNTEGDCCSYSWIEHISNANTLLGYTIIDIKDNIIDGFKDDETYINVYSVNIIAKSPKKWLNSTFSFEYRNSSNGYYGGSIELWNEDNYYFKQYKDEIKFNVLQKGF